MKHLLRDMLIGIAASVLANQVIDIIYIL